MVNTLNDSDNSHSTTALHLLQSAHKHSSLPTSPTDSQIHEIVQGAHHDLLINSGNKAYRTIWNELHNMKKLNHDLLTFLRFKNMPGLFFHNPEKIKEIAYQLAQASSEDELMEQFNEALTKTCNVTGSLWKEGLIEHPARDCADELGWYTTDGKRIVYSASTGSRLVYSSQHDQKMA
ncbi:hypothetical protein JOM56_012982 [Amanita muscaria]